MSAVTIDGLEDWVLASYRARAEASRQTVEEEVRQVLTRDVRAEAIASGSGGSELTKDERAARLEWAEELRRFREEIAAAYGVLPDSTPGIREERDSWG